MKTCWPALIVLAILSGCAATTVKQNPGKHDRGFRFYRPKPFVLINQAYTTAGEPLKGYYSLSITYLPDFSEKQSLHVRTGFGINNTDATFANGWNLTKLSIDVDSQTAENIGGVAEILKSVKGFVPTGADQEREAMIVQGSHVPLGYYEAVTGDDGNGKKRHYGWRYIGLLPFQSCPLEVGGTDCANCQSANLYGLVVEKNVMVFRPLHESCPEEVDAPLPLGEVLPE